MIKRVLIYFIIIASFIASFSGCNSQKRAERFRTLNIGVMSSMDYLPLAVAQANNYFEAEGIIVHLQKFYSANDRDAAIQSKNLDGSILDYTGAAIQHAGGIPIFLTSQCDGTFELIAGKHVTLESDEDFKGKSYAVSRNTVADFCTDMILKSKGIAPEAINKSEINKIPLRLEMVSNGKIDMTVLPDPFASIARANGNRSITSLQALGHRVTGIVFTEKALYRKEEAIQAFYVAYNRAINDLQTLPVASFKEILVKELGFTEALADSVKLPNFQSAAFPEANDLDVVSQWLKEKELIPDDFNIFDIVYSKKMFK